MVPHSTFTSREQKQHFVFLLGCRTYVVTVPVNNSAADLRGRTLRSFQILLCFLAWRILTLSGKCRVLFCYEKQLIWFRIFSPTALNSALQRKVEENNLGLLRNQTKFGLGKLLNFH
ncbi:hypothetical protein CDAR_39331 [Caerostris darwini]|uniref:Uncharacterized protein n=1 Tax=Caerostris darwini TaxID=1538125 RepID=A0AAV4U6E2_9ARAC|nr:hypothetical protein CDAR_39331 [Caerostris darwini]